MHSKTSVWLWNAVKGTQSDDHDIPSDLAPSRRKTAPKKGFSNKRWRHKSTPNYPLSSESSEAFISLIPTIKPKQKHSKREIQASKMHAKQIEEETNAFLDYLHLQGRGHEANKFIEKAQNAEGNYHIALKYFDDYLGQVEQRMKEVLVERRTPGYLPTGRLMEEEVLSGLEGMCMCTHCRLRRRGCFKDGINDASWAQEYESWIKNKDLGPLGTIEEYDPDWDDEAGPFDY